MGDFEYLEIIKCSHIRRKGVNPIMRKGKNLEIDQFMWDVGKGSNVILGQVEDLETFHQSELPVRRVPKSLKDTDSFWELGKEVPLQVEVSESGECRE
jgi:hypothetical protein